jgi:hypothetical protein
MSQQNPQYQPYQPQQPQPGWGMPPQAPQPPKRKTGKIVGLGCLGIVALFVLIGIVGAVAGSDSDSADTGSKDKAVAVSDKPKVKESKKPTAEKAPAKETKTQAEEFQACVAKSGTTGEKAAVKHVTKVTGVDKQNNILDAAEVFTDYKGGFMSSNAGDAKLIASAFASCYESENGLVTIYGSDGDLIANGNY